MDNITKQTISTRSKLENKKQILSSKVWALEATPNEIALNVNGSIPDNVEKMLMPNKVYSTNYTFEDSGFTKRKLIYKTNNKIYSLNIIEE